MIKSKVPTTAFTIFSGILVASNLLFVSLISEKNAAASICFDCPDPDFLLDEAKRAIDSGDLEGAKRHIDTVKGLLHNSTTLDNSTTK
jgi:hypothetical protein